MEEIERFLQYLHSRKIKPFQEDQLLLKGFKTNGFSVRLVYRMLVHSPPTAFPFRSIWNPIVPPGWVFLPGKTLDQLKRGGIPLANKCFLCEEENETIDHLLNHCSRAKMLWDLFLVIVGSSWVFPLTIGQSLLAWQGANVGEYRWQLT